MKILPPPPTTQSVVVNGDSATGEFNDVDPIPVTMNAEHVLSATIKWGDMKFTYLQKEDKFDESCFDEENNKVTVTNNSTCDIGAKISLSIGKTYSEALDEVGFRLTFENKNGEGVRELIPDMAALIGYSGDTSYTVYATVKKDSGLNAMHGYQIDNAEIGAITVEIFPVLSSYS